MDTLLRLRQVPLFANLTDADLAFIEPLVKRERYDAGATVCRQGDVGDALYIVDSGELKVLNVDVRGVERTIDTKQPGQFFGEMALLLGEPSKITITVKTAAELLGIRREDFSRLLQEHGDLRARLLAGAKPEVKKRFTQWQFPWLMQGEVPILVKRKHWWALVKSLPLPVGVALGAMAIAATVTALSAEMLPIGVAWAIAIFVSVLVSLYVGIDWRNDLFIVTNRRVAHLERVLLVREERHEAQIEKMQNVQVLQPTLFAKVIDVSDVVISTAAVRGAIVFAAVANGAVVRDTIFEQMQRAQAQRIFEERERLKKEICSAIRHPTAPYTSALAPLAYSGGGAGSRGVRQPRRPLKQVVGEWFALRIERDGTVTWRKHVFALIQQVWRPVVILLVLLLLTLLSLIGTLPSSLYSYIILVVLMLGMFGWAVWEWVDWRNDIYMVTSDRLVDLERNPLGVIKKSVTAPLAAIQNVSYRQPNLLSLLLNIGDVVIETAGATGQLVFLSLSQPSRVANEILQHVENARERQRQQQRADFPEWFAAYHDFLKDEQAAKSAASPGPASPTDSTLPPGDSKPIP